MVGRLAEDWTKGETRIRTWRQTKRMAADRVCQMVGMVMRREHKGQFIVEDKGRWTAREGRKNNSAQMAE